METYFGSIVPDSDRRRQTLARGFVRDSLRAFIPGQIGGSTSQFIAVCGRCISYGVLSPLECQSALLAYLRGYDCPELTALNTILFYIDYWDIPVSHFYNRSFKHFLLWLENLNITKSLLVERVSNGNDTPSFLLNYVQL